MVDLLDEQLIDLLSVDAHRSSESLAKHLNISSSTVRRRITKLIKERVVRIIALPEPNKIGLFTSAVLAFNVSHDKNRSILDTLRKYPQVRWVAATSGRFDIMIYAWFNATEDLFKFIEEDVSKIEGIKNSETFICLHVEKHA